VIDGLTNDDLIQAGITECPDPHLPGYFDYSPWWEVLTSDATFISTLTELEPGDEVNVTMGQFTGTCRSITVTDETRGQSFTTDQEYTGPAASAELIVEAPSGVSGPLRLSDYTVAEFIALGVTGQQNTLTSVQMKDTMEGAQWSTPSTINSVGFNLAYGDVAPNPP